MTRGASADTLAGVSVATEGGVAGVGLDVQAEAIMRSPVVMKTATADLAATILWGVVERLTKEPLVAEVRFLP